MSAFRCSLIRGGSSRGAYFLADRLPDDVVARNDLLVRIMGGPDALQVDGIGGGHPLTSKVAIVSRSAQADVDVDYLFLQIDPTRQTVSDAQNCGNLLAGVGLFAIDEGLVEAGQQSTVVRVRMLNTNALCHLELLTPGGRFEPSGAAAIDGVPGTGSPIVCNYLDIAGSSCGALLPTGHRKETIAGVEVSCVDNGMPVVVMRAVDFNISGYETPEALDANAELKSRLEAVRRQIGPGMGLGDVEHLSVPKMCLVSAPTAGGLIMTRTFIPHVCHKTIGVLGAVSVATACLLSGTTANELADVPDGNPKTMNVQHPSGSLQVQIHTAPSGEIDTAGVVRTARLLFKGEVWV